MDARHAESAKLSLEHLELDETRAVREHHAGQSLAGIRYRRQDPRRPLRRPQIDARRTLEYLIHERAAVRHGRGAVRSFRWTHRGSSRLRLWRGPGHDHL
ncbi:hypothetical protein Voc01_033620 [Virgisporangium ochraceum]|uniref:Uncharacterized protein n=1 Tax=Virgisporangium ochraceum TaxID=65505 RepID=A0A8J3ZU26_9ACTN|nr:hypothetical protein Voc01_033620 [Virgisporangium ochraceum]